TLSSDLPIPSPHVKQSTDHSLLRKAGIPRSSDGDGDGDAMALLTAPPAALVVLAVAAALLALLPRGSAQISAPPAGAPAPSSSLDCAGALLNLTPCLTYVERRSALTRPEKGCCGALAAVVGGDDAACLCALLAGNGVRVDTVRALALPTICRVDAPPPRLCAALGMPVAEPPGGAAADAPMDSGTVRRAVDHTGNGGRERRSGGLETAVHGGCSLARLSRRRRRHPLNATAVTLVDGTALSAPRTVELPRICTGVNVHTRSAGDGINSGVPSMPSTSVPSCCENAFG
ncbi:hypothetical protein Zm00014a_027520, partial [Zea mays]